MSEKTYTHRDLAALLGVSETTIKSYRRKFPGCIPVANHGKPIRFSEAASKVAMRIRDLFETGMSVEEVRVRLAKEFDWISPEAPAEPAAPAPAKRVSRVSSKGYEVGPEISIGVSNMAKSMVAMTQQQKSLLSKLESIERVLAELGLKGASELVESRGLSDEAAKEREQRFEERFAQLDKAVEALAGTIEKLSGELSRFMAGQGGTETAPPLEALPEEAQDHDAADSPPPDWDEEASDPPPAPKPKGPEVLKLQLGPVVVKAPPQHAQDEGEAGALQEPPKHFFGLPLVVRTQAGRYVSAGGRGRGRFSLTDLKALLSFNANAAKRLSMRWEIHGKGWWLFIEPEDGVPATKLLLMELPTQKSGNVAEILKLRSDDTDMHPAEFAVLLEKLAG